MKRVKITEDGFVWHVLTEAEAKQALGNVEVSPCMTMIRKA